MYHQYWSFQYESTNLHLKLFLSVPTDLTLAPLCSWAGWALPFTWPAAASTFGRCVSRSVEERPCEYRHVVIAHVKGVNDNHSSFPRQIPLTCPKGTHYTTKCSGGAAWWVDLQACVGTWPCPDKGVQMCSVGSHATYPRGCCSQQITVWSPRRAESRETGLFAGSWRHDTSIFKKLLQFSWSDLSQFA